MRKGSVLVPLVLEVLQFYFMHKIIIIKKRLDEIFGAHVKV